MDRRQQKTRAAIFQAFGNLLAKKSFSKITVQEIIDEANIGRTTFYDHFAAKDYLLKEMCADLFTHIFSDKLSAENTHDFSFTTGEPRTMVTHILYHLLDNERNILSILTSESGELFLGFFRQYLNELISTRMLNGLELSDKRVPEDFWVNHISSSFVGMAQWWIRNGLKQTPEELSEYFMAVISPSIVSGSASIKHHAPVGHVSAGGEAAGQVHDVTNMDVLQIPRRDGGGQDLLAVSDLYHHSVTSE